MKKLILVRYAEYINGHITEQGIRTMQQLAEQFEPFVINSTIHIIAAEVDRAVESTNILAQELGVGTIKKSQSLYAAEEDGKEPNLREAAVIINEFGESCDIVIAVLSREYIEILPHYLLPQAPEKVTLQRGEAIIINLDKLTVEFIK